MGLRTPQFSVPRPCSGRRRSPDGFTLIEVLLGVVIGAMVVVAALLTLGNVSRSREGLGAVSQLQAKARYALDRLREDLANIYVGPGADKQVFVGTQSIHTQHILHPSGEQEPDGATSSTTIASTDRLRFYALTTRGAHSDRAGSEIHEIEYGVMAAPDGGEAVLARRWAEVEDITQGNAAGIVVELAEYVRALRFAYHDGQAWQDVWPAEQTELPRLVRVQLTLAPDAAAPQDETVTYTSVMALGAAARWTPEIDRIDEEQKQPDISEPTTSAPLH